MWWIRTYHESGCAAPARPWITALRHWTVAARLIFFDRVTNQRARSSADTGADERTPNSSPTGDITNDRAGARTSRGAGSGRRVAGIQIHRGQREQ